jgi:cation/acetate symporter
MTVAFVSIWLFSITDSSDRAQLDRQGFEAMKVRSETGIGASSGSGH